MNIKERKMYIPEQHLEHYNLYKQKQNKTKQNPAKIKFYWTDFTQESGIIIVTIVYNNETLSLFI